MIKTPLSTVIGGAFWTPSATILGGTSKTFNQLIKSLFANNEQGFFYDPNDLTTMFQDAAGTVPVTGAEQPVGLVLDKSKGMVLGSELATTSNVVSVPIGGPTFSLYPIANVQRGKTYRISFTVTNYLGSADLGVAGPATLWLDNSGVSVSGDSSVVCTRTFIGTNNVIHLHTRSSNQCVFSNISVKELFGNHAYQTTSASRPILRQNATTGAYYLEFDGSDDFLQTSNIDFTSTDKVSLFAGVHKLSDASTATVVELSSNLNASNGSLYISASDIGGANYRFASKGTLPMYGTLTIASGYAAPISSVISAKGSISQDYSEIRINSVQKATIAVDQGTGNYGNYPLYIGRRGGASLPFNGHIYSLIGIGKLTSDAETAAIEKELAKRTGVTLNV